jgi:glucokinase
MSIGPQTAGPGRLPILAIDIGGTKVALGLVDADGELLAVERFATPREAPAAAVATILDRARTFVAGRPIAVCGIVLPAVIDDGFIVWSAESIAGWDGIQLRDLAVATLEVPCIVEFDGYGATLGEAWQGHARGYPDAAIVIVGTGIGAGFVHEGRLYRGRTAIAGGIGWIRLPAEDGFGPKLEAVASGPAILAAARAAARAAGADADTYHDTEAVFTRAVSGDPLAAAVVERAMRALAIGVGAVVALLAPDIVVLGGSIGSRPDVVAAVRRLLPETTQPVAAAGVRVEGSALDALSSLYGAARLAQQFLEGDAT